MTANLLTLTQEKREVQTEAHLLPATVLSMKRVVFVVLCCTLLMLFTAPAWAQDICQAAGAPYPCGVTITITGASGNLTATFGGSGIPYDGDEDQMVGIQNLSNVPVGAIILSAPAADSNPPYTSNLFAFDGDGACTYSGKCNYGPTGYEGPDNTFLGTSPDLTTGKVLFTVALAANGGTTWFSLENTPNAVAAIGENKALTAGSTTVFPFGPFTCTSNENGTACTETSVADDLQVAPRNSATGDTLTVTAVPVPAGPLSLDNWGTDYFGIEGPLSPEPPSGQQRFSATNYSNLACVPYSDFSSSFNPGCVELELDCPPADSDTCQFVYSATADFNIDKLSLPNGIGGAHFLGQHDGNPTGYNGQCPTTGFNVDIIESYTATKPDPITGGGRGNSCFVTAFDPTATVVPPGTTVSTFFGFEFPLFDNKINPVFVGLPVPLSWDFNNSLGQPVTNLSLCKAVNPDGTCATSGVSPPWVYLSLSALSSTTACQAVAAASSPLPSVFNSGLLNFGRGEYSFLWNTLTRIKGLSGCQVSVVAQFDNGLVVAPAVFQYH
jgi:hypothetical protein